MKRTIAGIDEAGRGAVIGPLVMAGVSFLEDETLFEILRLAGVTDSKFVTALKRKELARLVRKLKHRYKTVRLEPTVLSRHSLNELEAYHTARLLNGLCPHIAYLDVPASGRGIGRYCDKVRAACRQPSVRIEGGNNLDGKNIVVAAASIIAKETREQEVHRLHSKYGDFGSGYPADPKTRTWLKNWRRRNNNWPKIVRTKWTTLASL